MLKKKEVKKLTGNEFFKNNNFSILEFWQYGFSNLNSNVLRGSLAEFIVENLLKDKSEIGIRNPWNDFDILYKNKKIEVKCSSYIQDWDQEDFSKIIFSGLKAKDLYWSKAVSEFNRDNKKDYKADIYVLCLVNHKNPETLDLLNLDQWSFFILTKEKLKNISNNSSSISITRLEKNNYTPIKHEEVKKYIDNIIE
ncbi:MAG: hypothetical protein PHI91_03650 [Candidatus Pacebacteria bacterium]|nr:hypothetical protein [Candidatus Paceibacterota bacterium]